MDRLYQDALCHSMPDLLVEWEGGEVLRNRVVEEGGYVLRYRRLSSSFPS